MRSALLLLFLLGLTACGEQSLTGPEGFTRAPCRPPAALVAMVTGQPFAPAEMRSALLHAADPMNRALGDTRDARALQHAILLVAAHIEAVDYDDACRLLGISGTLLAGLPDAPATLPDRDGIRLILALTAQALAEAMPE